MLSLIQKFFFTSFQSFFIFCDAPTSWQFGLQDPATPVAEGIIFFHNYFLIIKNQVIIITYH